MPGRGDRSLRGTSAHPRLRRVRASDRREALPLQDLMALVIGLHLVGLIARQGAGLMRDLPIRFERFDEVGEFLEVFGVLLATLYSFDSALRGEPDFA